MTKCALLRRKPPHFFYIYPTKHPERNKKKGSKAYFLHFAKPSIFAFLQPYGERTEIFNSQRLQKKEIRPGRSKAPEAKHLSKPTILEKLISMLH